MTHRREDDIEREIRAHLELEAEEREADGLSRTDAEYAARRAFGNVALVQEDVRAVWTSAWLDDTRQDLRYALRTLRRNLGFAAVAILTLALGIGVTTATFSVVTAVLLRPLPYSNAARIVHIIENVPAKESMSGRPMRLPALNRAEFNWWRENVRSFSHMAITANEARTMMTRGGTVRLEGARVSPALFAIRDVRPIVGRGLYPSDERADARVIVLGAATWQRYFDGAPDVVDREVILDAEVYTVVGVMPPAFGSEAFWTPYVAGPSRQGTVEFLAASALLRPDVSLEGAAAEVNNLGIRLRGVPPPARETPRFEVARNADLEVVAVRPVLRVLTAAVLVVLLIVCANVANLLLVRGAGRHREISIRRALGAPRPRIIRQLVTESLVLSIAGAMAGTVLAYASVDFVRRGGIIDLPPQFRPALGPVGPTILPRADELAIDPTALAFALGLSILTGLVFGVAPALRLSRVNHRQALAPSDLTSREATGGPGSWRLGYMLAVAQLALATTLIVGAGLLLRSFVNLATVDVGFDTDTQIFRLISPGQYPRSRKLALAHDLATRLHGLPGVEAAGFVNTPPLTATTGWRNLFLPSDMESQRARRLGTGDLASGGSFMLGTSPEYLRAMGVTLIEGRWLNEQDAPDRPRVLLVNRKWAQQLSPNASPVGKTVAMRGARNVLTSFEVVGVVDNIRLRMDQMSPGSNPLAEMPSVVFTDLRQQVGQAGDRPSVEADHMIGEPGGLTFAVKTTSQPLSLAAISSAARGIDRELAVEGLSTMGNVVSGLIGRQRFYALVVSIFAAIAALIAAVGVYGVLAYAMTQRVREFGIRLALGAAPQQVLGVAMRHGVAIVGIGVTIGVSGALASTRYLSSMLAGVTPLDTGTYVAVAVAFTAMALLASYLPARRATRVNPVVALRCE
jgi:putative ABC transport system permease protein